MHLPQLARDCMMRCAAGSMTETVSPRYLKIQSVLQVQAAAAEQSAYRPDECLRHAVVTALPVCAHSGERPLQNNRGSPPD